MAQREIQKLVNEIMATNGHEQVKRGPGRPPKTRTLDELISEFAAKLTELVEQQANERAREMLVESFGKRRPGRPRGSKNKQQS